MVFIKDCSSGSSDLNSLDHKLWDVVEAKNCKRRQIEFLERRKQIWEATKIFLNLKLYIQTND